MNNILLDTHIWIWLMNGDHCLLQPTREIIDNAYQNGNVFVSAISSWEVSMLEQKKRIILNKPCIEWIKESLRLGLQILPLTPEIAVESCQLPEYFARDPADRMIIASARVESLILLTRDEKMIAYGHQEKVSVLSV